MKKLSTILALFSLSSFSAEPPKMDEVLNAVKKCDSSYFKNPKWDIKNPIYAQLNKLRMSIVDD